ncbi:MAG TPA: ABC transporter ATP-binding protein [Burkholderiales bacterium]|nr:ABC transporter ATP-binding protein [Burkholderiales bacterium]
MSVRMPALVDKLKGKVQPEKLVQFDNVDFSYNANPILRNLNISFPRGKVVAIMGGSGSGKTTLLRLIGGQIKPQKGSVRFDGQAVETMSHADLYAARRRMGMLFQFGALFTDLSVFENVAFPMREHLQLPEPMIRDLVLMKLHAVGLRGAHALKPAELSGGMARRVALARAIVLDPNLIMYDEPFAGLDPISMAVIANLIRRLNSALGATSIVVTHDVQESFKIVDHVCFLSRGEIVAQGTPEQMQASDEPYVRQFVDGQIDGPVPFHYVAGEYGADLGMGG